MLAYTAVTASWRKGRGWMVGSLSRRIVLLFNGNGWVEAGLGRIIEHDVISAQLSVQI